MVLPNVLTSGVPKVPNGCQMASVTFGTASHRIRRRADAKHLELGFCALLSKGASEVELALVYGLCPRIRLTERRARRMLEPSL